MSWRKYVQMLVWLGVLVFCLAFPAIGALPSKQEVIDTMILVNDHWINNSDYGDNGWARATYYEGNMAMYAVYPDQKYYDYALGWAESHHWELIGGDTTRIADNQCAGQTYLDLYEYVPAPYKIAHIQASIDRMVNSSKKDDWYWIDALQMAMPVFARFGAMYSDTDYYDKMYDLYHHTKNIEGQHGLYSDNDTYQYGDYLWWRDAYNQTRTSPNGKMFYWSRGNGWVIAAHVRTIQNLPDTDPHYAEYAQTLQKMASSLKDRQQSDGFWYVNLDDPNHNAGDAYKDDGPETSGTAFFTYAIAWGINNGFLDGATYRPVVEKAWNGMVKDAVHTDGKVGYCQRSATSPEGGQPIGFNDTTDFCVGAFLLAGSEVAQMAGDTLPAPPVAVDDAYQVGEGGILSVVVPGVLGNDSDGNGDPLEAILVSDVSSGALSLNPDGSFSYAPNAGFLGTDTFTYKATDGTAESNEATVSIGVVTGDAVNFYANPVESYNGGEDKNAVVTIEEGGGALHIVGNGWKKIYFPYTVTADTILEFDFQSTAEGEIHGIGFDTDNSANSARVFKLHGTQGWGIQTFNDYAGESPKHYMIPVGQYYTGEMLYLIFVNDHDVGSPTAESVFKNIKVYELSDVPAPPVAVDDAYQVGEGGILSVVVPGVLGNDSDGNGDPLEAILVSDVSSGALSLNPDGSFTYAPYAGFLGTDTFTYKATDGTAESNEATVSIGVVTGDAVNFYVNPVESYNGGEDKNAVVTIEEGGGALHIVGNGWKKIYFPYTVTADTILEFDFQSTAEGEIHGIGFDTDNSANSARVFKLHGTQGWGIQTFNDYAGESPKHYMIPVGQYYTGEMLYLIFVNDHDVGSPTAESVFKNIKVYELSDVPAPPVAVDDAYQVGEGGILSVVVPGVLGNDSDGNGDPLEAILVSDVSSGALSLNPDGSFSYAPNAGFLGTDTFTYKATDGTAESNEATVSIGVVTGDAVNFYANPVESYNGGEDKNAVVTIEEGGGALHIVGNGWKKIYFPYTVTADTILEFDFQSTAEGEIHGIGFDTDNSANSARVFKLHGTQGWGIQTFNDYAGESPKHYMIPVGQYYTGEMLYLIFVNDHDVGSPTAESVFKNIKVYELSDVPAPPVAVDDAYQVGEGGILSVVAPGVLGNDSDGNGDPLEAILVSDVSSGVLSLDLDGSFTYAPNAGFLGTDTFTYKATDLTAESNEATVSIGVMTGDAVNFYVNPVESYNGGEDKNAVVTIEEGGTALHIVGNGWKKIYFPYTVTADTILEFDFQSTAEGEIHGIGFDTDNSANSDRVFKLHGTQGWGIQTFNDYAGESPKHYTIPVGQYYTGEMLYLTFVNDHDVGSPTAESVFKNIKVYE